MAGQPKASMSPPRRRSACMRAPKPSAAVRRGRDSCRPGSVYSHTCSMMGFGRQAMPPSWARSRSGLVKRPEPPPGDWPRSPNWYVAGAGTTNTRTGLATPGMPQPQRSGRCWVSRTAGLPIKWNSVWRCVTACRGSPSCSWTGGSVIGSVRRSPTRTELVQDRALLARIDSVISHHAVNWGPLSDHKLEKAIDVWVDRYDPGALRHTSARAQDRGVHVGSRDDGAGITGITGRLYATDAVILDRRLKQMAHGVCDDDPRTISQRRADALGALAAGSDRLACTCGSPECRLPMTTAAPPAWSCMW